MIDFVVAPVLQSHPADALLVSNTLSPGQMVVDPLAEICGTGILEMVHKPRLSVMVIPLYFTFKFPELALQGTRAVMRVVLTTVKLADTPLKVTSVTFELV